MKLKLDAVFIILGLFLLKVGVIDNFRNFGQHNNNWRTSASERIRPVSVR